MLEAIKDFITDILKFLFISQNNITKADSIIGKKQDERTKELRNESFTLQIVKSLLFSL